MSMISELDTSTPQSPDSGHRRSYQELRSDRLASETEGGLVFITPEEAALADFEPPAATSSRSDT